MLMGALSVRSTLGQDGIRSKDARTRPGTAGRRGTVTRMALQLTTTLAIQRHAPRGHRNHGEPGGNPANSDPADYCFVIAVGWETGAVAVIDGRSRRLYP